MRATRNSRASRRRLKPADTGMIAIGKSKTGKSRHVVHDGRGSRLLHRTVRRPPRRRSASSAAERRTVGSRLSQTLPSTKGVRPSWHHTGRSIFIPCGTPTRALAVMNGAPLHVVGRNTRAMSTREWSRSTTAIWSQLRRRRNPEGGAAIWLRRLIVKSARSDNGRERASYPYR